MLTTCKAAEAAGMPSLIIAALPSGRWSDEVLAILRTWIRRQRWAPLGQTSRGWPPEFADAARLAWSGRTLALSQIFHRHRKCFEEFLSLSRSEPNPQLAYFEQEMPEGEAIKRKWLAAVRIAKGRTPRKNENGKRRRPDREPLIRLMASDHPYSENVLRDFLEKIGHADHEILKLMADGRRTEAALALALLPPKRGKKARADWNESSSEAAV